MGACSRRALPSAQAAAAAGDGGPDRLRPMRPHPSAAHTNQRRARRDGHARSSTSGRNKLCSAAPQARRPSNGRRGASGALPPKQGPKARPIFHLKSQPTFYTAPPARPPRASPPAASILFRSPAPRRLLAHVVLTSGLPAHSRPRLPAPPTHILGVDVCPPRHQRLRRRRVASSSRRVQGRRSLRRGRRVRLLGETSRRLTCSLTAARPRDAAV